MTTDVSLAPQNHGTTSEMATWETAVDSHKRFKKITPENRKFFNVRLGKESDLDTYALSPVYYALTGRKGLWIYQDGSSYVPLCWHPNAEGQILVFPARGQFNPNIIKQLLAEIPVPPCGIRLARLNDKDITSPWFKKITGNNGRTIQLIPVKETVLDWLYPVRILSTAIVAQMHGREFMKIRNSVKQAIKNSITIERLTSNHLKEIVSFAYRWANSRATNIDELIGLLEPYKEIISLFRDDTFNMDGLIFKIDGRIQAVTIWEKPNTAHQIANMWISLANTSYKGISEFAIIKTAETLNMERVPLINFGGSETKGLDSYKKKYAPAFSLNLHSIEAIVEGTDLILETLIKIREMRMAI